MEFARLKGQRIGYWSTGSGAPVVLVHGSFATSSAWKRFAASLGEKARCVALDLPGWGESEPLPAHSGAVDLQAAAVEAVAKNLGHEPVHLAGHSHGGTIALAAALAGRVPLRSLTLFEPLPVSLLAQTGDGKTLDEIVAFVSRYRRAFEAGDKWAARSVIDLWGGPGSFDAMAPAVRDFIATGTAQNLRDWEGNFAFHPSPEALQTLRVPTTIVLGASSHRIAKLLGRRLSESTPGSKLIELEGASHFMIHTHAADSARQIAL
jgi:pimeloyl-ACP methyl ester carboxylesterase